MISAPQPRSEIQRSPSVQSPSHAVDLASQVASDTCPKCFSHKVQVLGSVLNFTIASCQECGSEWDYVHNDVS